MSRTTTTASSSGIAPFSCGGTKAGSETCSGTLRQLNALRKGGSASAAHGLRENTLDTATSWDMTLLPFEDKSSVRTRATHQGTPSDTAQDRRLRRAP